MTREMWKWNKKNPVVLKMHMRYEGGQKDTFENLIYDLFAKCGFA